MNTVSSQEQRSGLEIAIIGMACRVPGAQDIKQFWDNLCSGKENISFLSDEELLAAGVDSTLLRHPDYVRGRGVLEDIDMFDASFFKILPKDAEIMDPQQRIFLECAWEALEHAGYDPLDYQGNIGIYAGSRANSYLLTNLAEIRDRVHDYHQVTIASDKDYLTTRTAYKLNLQGPGVTVQTACSTSLVATHLACQSLLNGECDIALAGGVSIALPQKSGHLYEEGGIISPDGHCRSFDASARGTVISSGIGIVILKRLTDAEADGDTIYAIIKGSAINNDGARKVGFTAPAIDGQAKVIHAAQLMAEITADSISYIEAHGTATPLGDPIEIAGLTQAFRQNTQARGFCALGSVKSNIGHLDTAAGVIGLIKTVLMLKHKMLPPSLHFTRPNPEIDFAHSPFYVNTQLTPWNPDHLPRRAGVSSFGIGGTNAHVIVEEAYERETVQKPQKSWHILLLSARTRSALTTMITQFSHYLEQHPDLDIADVTYTTQIGRHAFEQRTIAVVNTLDGALESLKSTNRAIAQASAPRSIVFLFPGQGAQYVNMGRALYQHEPIFRDQIDICCELLQTDLGLDLRTILYPDEEHLQVATQHLNQTRITQPALFVIEYALAKLWIEYGVTPHAMLGHSLGEYVAACLAGVFSLKDALHLVALRGTLMQQLPAGAMLAVAQSARALQPFTDEDPTLSLAAINSPTSCVIAGPHTALEKLQQQLVEQNVKCRYLATSHAFHSSMMDPILDTFVAHINTLDLHPPTLPYISNVTGTWATAEQVTDPHYYAQHLRNTVHFSQGLAELQQDSQALFLEVGPGNTLAALLAQQTHTTEEQEIFPSLRHTYQQDSDRETLLTTIGKLWMRGIQIQWSTLHRNERRYRIPLPTYPFERQRYWIASSPQQQVDDACAETLDYEPSIPQQKENMPMKEQSGGRDVEQESRHQEAILSRLKQITTILTGIDITDRDYHRTFMELNFESLILLQLNQAIRDTFGIKISFRQLFDEHPTLFALATYLAQVLPQEPAEEEKHENLSDIPTSRISSSYSAQKGPVLSTTASDIPTASIINPDDTSPRTSTDTHNHTVEQIIARQLDVMSKQLELLKQHATPDTADQEAKTPQVPMMASLTPHTDQPPLPTAKEADRVALGPFSPLQPAITTNTLTTQQQEYIAALLERYIQRTAGSKRLAQQHRPVLADPLAAAGFRLLYKEAIYPLSVQRATQSRMWDVDDNEYIDIAMGFGVHLFGHAPDFIMKALQEQLDTGIALGVQSPLAGEVAALICEITGMERAMFCNSGTDAVMMALRIARTVTGRSLVVLFAGSYHGSYEGVLARTQHAQNYYQTTPSVPGIPARMVEDVIVLPYADPTTLNVIEQHAHKIAAVLVEPVQSRRSDLQPTKFIHQLRDLTRNRDIALIFDEAITGFRILPGGAQSWFNVQADIATYSKVVSGGMPFSVIAGAHKYIDALDGGMWQYGDQSYPPAEITHFAGTFFKHPLSLAAARAVLLHIKQQGPELQQQLNQRTASLVDTINAFLQTEQIAMHMIHYGSLFSFVFEKDLQFSDLFFYHLNEQGIYTWRGRTCFLSTAHTDEDIASISRAIQTSALAMKSMGFLQGTQASNGLKTHTLQTPGTPPQPALTEGPDSIITDHTGRKSIPLTAVQKQVWVAIQMDQQASGAYNESKTLHLRGPLQITAMRQAFQQLSARHEALRTTFSAQGDQQYIAPMINVAIPLIDFSHADMQERQVQAEKWISEQGNRPFDLIHGPVWTAHILKLEAEYHLLVLTFNHLVIDGWSSAIVLDELSRFYSAACQGQTCQLPPATQFSDYSAWQAQQVRDHDDKATEAFWLQQFTEPSPALALPGDRPRPLQKTYRGFREELIFSADMYSAMQQASLQSGSTLFMFLLTNYMLLLHALTDQDDIIVGVPSAGQRFLGGRGESLVGFCVNLLPMRSRISDNVTFIQHLTTIKKLVMETTEHQHYTLSQLVRKLKVRRDPGRLPLVMTTFNVEQQRPAPAFFNLEAWITFNKTFFAKYDLGLTIHEKPSQLVLSCNYNTDIFTASTIRRWIEQYELLLQTVITHPESTWSELKHLLATSHLQQTAITAKKLEEKNISKLKMIKRKTI